MTVGINGRKKVIILLTDGKATEDLDDMIEALKNTDITVGGLHYKPPHFPFPGLWSAQLRKYHAWGDSNVSYKSSFTLQEK